VMNSIRDYMTENVRRGEKMVQGLLVSLGQRVSRQRIRDCMRLLDPDGVHIRQLRRLKRRVYEVPGSHYLWHLDGCHKLIKFGFVVHTCIDGFSRYVVYTVCRDNNRANTVLKAFKQGSKDIQTLPARVRTDKGGENVNVFRFMYGVFGDDTDCCFTGKSTGNQKVERLHRDSTEKALEQYIFLFHYFVRCGLDVDNNLHMYILHYLFMDRINESLTEFQNVWNNHKLRSVENKSPTQLLLLSHVRGQSFGVKIGDSAMNIYDLLEDVEDVEEGENQVICESKYSPFDENQKEEFASIVNRLHLIDRVDVTNYDALFNYFIYALNVAMNILRSA